MAAARIATEMIMKCCHNLCMLGALVEGPAMTLGDNLSMILNATMPLSMLKKKHLACNHHQVREAVAAKIMRFCHIDLKDNVSDVLTKTLPRTQCMALAKKLVLCQPVDFSG